MSPRRRTTLTVLVITAALLSASMLAPAFGAPKAVSAVDLAKKLKSTLTIAKRADRNAKRAIKALQVRPDAGSAGPSGAQGLPGAPGSAGSQGPQGLRGAKGDKGAPGTPGQPATRLWAVVNAAGAIVRASGATSSNNLSTGAYEVIFNRDVSACSYQATQSTVGGVTGEILVQPRSTDAQGVYVATANSAGTPGNRDFHLAVFC